MSIFQLGCQPIFKSFSDSLPVWGNPDLILYHFLRIIKFRVDVHFKHGAPYIPPGLSKSAKVCYVINFRFERCFIITKFTIDFKFELFMPFWNCHNLKLKLQICTATVYFLTDGVLVLTVFSWTGPAEHFKSIRGQAYLLGLICPPNLDWNRVYISDRNGNKFFSLTHSA